MIDQDKHIRSLLGEVLSQSPEAETAAGVVQRAAEIDTERVVRPHRGRSARVLITASAAAVLIGGLVAITTNSDNDPTTPADNSAIAYTPPGTEVPLVATPTMERTDEVVKPGSLVHVVVAGEFDLSRYTTVAMYEGHVVQMDCFNRTCTPFLDDPAPQTGLVSDSGLSDIWSWVGVPSDASYVVYTDDDTVLWQRPIAGIAAFPVTAGFNAAVAAVDATGHTVATADLHMTPPPVDLPPFDWSRYRDLTADQQGQMHLIINDAMRSCVQTAATPWSDCVAQADRALVQWLDDRAQERMTVNP